MHFGWFNFTHHKFIQYDQKGFSLSLMLIGFLLLIGIGAGAFYFGTQFSQKPQVPIATPTPSPASQRGEQPPQPTPTPDETVSWKTYTNTKYGYSLNYPQNWVIEDLGTYIYISESGFEKSSGNIYISPEESGRGFWNGTKTTESSLNVNGIKADKTDFLTTDGHPFFSFIRLTGYNKNGWDPDYNSIYIDLSKQVQINENPVDFENPIIKGDVSNIKIYNQILSTLKLL